MTNHGVVRTYLDIHVIQTIPPANINRDDAGSPKQAIYGGARRARVSSQAWKRATRLALAEAQPLETQGTRTKRLATLIAERLVERTGVDRDDAIRIATAVVSGKSVKYGKSLTMDGQKKDQTSYLLFFGRPQVERVVEQIADRASTLASMSADKLKAEVADVDVAAALKDGHPLDVALFGRMVADLGDLNVDAATQVAHAISTHPVEIQFDYFTAVDDENPDEETGAGMIGTVEFNSATLYRYATLAVHQLADNLTDKASVPGAARLFLEAFVKSIPSGHQNSFAHRTRPCLVVAVVRDDQPVNLVTAFEAPVQASRAAGGLEAESVRRLARELRTSIERWGDQPRLIVASYADHGEKEVIEAFGPSVPFSEVLARVEGALSGSEPAEAAS